MCVHDSLKKHPFWFYYKKQISPEFCVDYLSKNIFMTWEKNIWSKSRTHCGPLLSNVCVSKTLYQYH